MQGLNRQIIGWIINLSIVLINPTARAEVQTFIDQKFVDSCKELGGEASFSPFYDDFKNACSFEPKQWFRPAESGQLNLQQLQQLETACPSHRVTVSALHWSRSSAYLMVRCQTKPK